MAFALLMVLVISERSDIFQRPPPPPLSPTPQPHPPNPTNTPPPPPTPPPPHQHPPPPPPANTPPSHHPPPPTMHPPPPTPTHPPIYYLFVMFIEFYMQFHQMLLYIILFYLCVLVFVYIPRNCFYCMLVLVRNDKTDMLNKTTIGDDVSQYPVKHDFLSRMHESFVCAKYFQPILILQNSNLLTFALVWWCQIYVNFEFYLSAIK